MAYGEFGFCRCRAPKRADGQCPYACPSVSALKPPKKKRQPREKTTPLPPGGIEAAVRIASKRLGVPSMAWGGISPRGVAASRARRKAERLARETATLG